MKMFRQALIDGALVVLPIGAVVLLVLGIIRYKDDPAYLPNTVVEQAISPYSQVAQGAAIDVTVTSPGGGAAAPPEEEGSVSNLGED